jgi:uncharacterized protein (TIGR02145 family)
MYLICTVCKKEIPANSKFCGYCGSLVKNPDETRKQPTWILKQKTLVLAGGMLLLTLVIFLAFNLNHNGRKAEYETGTFVDSRDDYVYKWVKIGDQIWMAENLAYLPEVCSSSEKSNILFYYYVYGYEGTSVNKAKATENYKTYGVLYNWSAAMKASPTGWHLPSDDEWKKLEIVLGLSRIKANKNGWRGSDVGNMLKENGVSHWYYGNEASNESGFTALPGGMLMTNFTMNRECGYWWSSKEVGSSSAWFRSMYARSGDICRIKDSKQFALSVRCIRD